MNSNAKKIKSINKLIPSGVGVLNKIQPKNPSYNLPMGTPIQSKRPFNKENEKSPSHLNGNFSARGPKNVNFKVSSSNFGRNNENQHTKSSYLDANNSFRMNSAGKKLEYQQPSQRKSVDNSATKKTTNSSVSNLYGVIKGKNINYYI